MHHVGISDMRNLWVTAVTSAFEDKRREKALARERREAELARIEDDEAKRRVNALCERALQGARRNAERRKQQRLDQKRAAAAKKQRLLEERRQHKLVLRQACLARGLDPSASALGDILDKVERGTATSDELNWVGFFVG